MSLLADATVQGLAGLLRAHALPDACVVQTRTPVSDAAGGETVTWPEGAPLPCRLAPLGGGGTERDVGGRETALQAYRLVLAPADAATVGPADRVRVTRLGGATVSRVFEVIDQGGKSWEVARTVYLQELL